MITIGLIFILIGLLFVLWALYHQDKLDDIRDELDKREIQLDERANRIAADEAMLTNEWQMLRKAKEELYDKRFIRPTDDSGH